MAKLTKRTIDASKISSSDYVIWDEEVARFRVARLCLREAKLRSAVSRCRPLASLHHRSTWGLDSRGGKARGESPARPSREGRQPR
jgi:hypothetical protein